MFISFEDNDPQGAAAWIETKTRDLSTGHDTIRLIPQAVAGAETANEALIWSGLICHARSSSRPAR